MSRKAAPKIYNILLTMKLEVPPDNDARSIVMMRMSRPSSPPPIPLPPLPVQAPVQPVPVPPVPPVQPVQPVRPIQPVHVQPMEPAKPPAVVKVRPEPRHAPSSTSPTSPIPPASPPTVEEATAQLRRLMQSSGIQETLNLPPPRPPPVEQLPPRPPSTNPWDVKKSPAVGERRLREDFAFERRAPVPMSNSPIEGLSPVSPDRDRDGRFPIPPRPRPVRRGTDRSSNQGDEPTTLSPTLSPTGLESSSYERGYNIFPGHGPRSRTPNSGSFLSSSIPEDYTLNRGSGGRYPPPPPEEYSSNRGSNPRYGGLPPRSSSTQQNPQYLSRPESVESTPSSVFDHRKVDRDSNSSEYRSSAVSNAATSPNLGVSELSPLSQKPPFPNDDDEARKDSLTITGANIVDYGPIPVDSEETADPNGHLPKLDCTIAANSSFYIHKGFCDGAQEVMRGEPGVRKTKRPVSHYSSLCKTAD